MDRVVRLMIVVQILDYRFCQLILFVIVYRGGQDDYSEGENLFLDYVDGGIVFL